MLELIKQKNQDSFEKLAEYFAPMIDKLANSFSRDRELAKLESCESLKSIVLLKLNEVCEQFVYESDLSDTDNERRFIGLFKRCAKNILIDHQYSANLSKRKPTQKIIAISNGNHVAQSEGAQDTDNSDGDVDIPDVTASVPEQVQSKELIELVAKELDGIQRLIFKYILMGYKPEMISGKIGLPSSRVRYLINTVINQKVMHYAGHSTCSSYFQQRNIDYQQS